MKTISPKVYIYLTGTIFWVAGLIHFINPSFYIQIIPNYLPYPSVLNLLAGFIEIVLGILFFWDKYRYKAGLALVVFLAILMLAHVEVIRNDGCITETFCIPIWLAWARLFLQPFIMYWVYYVSKLSLKK
jgi:uncharacterized membrane protein